MKTDNFSFDERTTENGISIAVVDGVKLELKRGECENCFFCNWKDVDGKKICPKECYTGKCWSK